MEVIKKKKKKLIPFILRIIPILLIFYFIFMLFNQQVQINDKKQKLENLTKKLEMQENENAELRKNLENNEEKRNEHIEETARKNLGLSKKDEKVFVNASGK